MTKQYVTADELKKAADYLASTKEQGGCYHWKVYANTDDNKDIYIVLGWRDGFDKNDPDKDKYQDEDKGAGSWRIFLGISRHQSWMEYQSL